MPHGTPLGAGGRKDWGLGCGPPHPLAAQMAPCVSVFITDFLIRCHLKQRVSGLQMLQKHRLGAGGGTPMTRALPSVTTAYHEATQTLGTGGLDLRCVILDKLLHVSVLVPERG